jgi:hypothetical protein
MPLNILLVPGVLLSSGVFLIIMATITFYSILGEVNGRRSPEEHISMLFVNIRFFEVMRFHKQLFPASKKRAATYVLFGVGIVLGFSIFLFGS